MNTCANCRHWTPSDTKKEWHNKNIRIGYCEGLAADYACADADDDSGLTSSFQPAETFGCIGWTAKE